MGFLCKSIKDFGISTSFLHRSGEEKLRACVFGIKGAFRIKGSTGQGHKIQLKGIKKKKRFFAFNGSR